MKITKRQLQRIIREELQYALREKKDKFMGDVSKDIKKKGSKGVFSNWCKDQGFSGVNQSCVDKAYSVGKPWKARAALAVTYSRSKGGAPSLKYPDKKD
jgi:isocitrate dehydrogenase